jgi:malonate transporter MadM subunit
MGVEFWGAIYIPIVVAMAAQQNVYGALTAGQWRFWRGVAAVGSPLPGAHPGEPLPKEPVGHSTQDCRVIAMYESMMKVITGYGMISAFAIVGVTMWVSYWISNTFTKGRLHGSAIAILLGLVLSYIGGALTGGQKGVVDIPLLSGIGLLGGAMLRDFAIVATAFGVSVDELKRPVLSGMALFVGVGTSFIAGVAVAMAFGYTDAVSLTTIGAGAVTYIVGPVTGAAIGASSEVMALSIAAGLIKAILVMVMTPFVAR